MDSPVQPEHSAEGDLHDQREQQEEALYKWAVLEEHRRARVLTPYHGLLPAPCGARARLCGEHADPLSSAK